MNYSRKIERFVEGLMEPQEQQAFRKEMSGNPELRGLVEDAVRVQQAGEQMYGVTGRDVPAQLDDDAERSARQDAEKFAGSIGDEDGPGFKRFKEMVRHASDTFHGDVPVSSPAIRIRRISYGVAAAVILAIGIPLMLHRFKATTTPAGIYNQFYSRYYGSELLIEQTRADNELLHAIEVYETGNFREARILLDPFLGAEPSGKLAHFYHGLASMETGQFNEAIDHLREAESSGNPKLVMLARWYLGLAYLRINETGSAIEQFSMLVQPGGELSKEARKILKKTKQL